MIQANDLKDLDVLMCTGHALLATIIRDVTHSQFSHAALVCLIGDQLYVIDAQSDGFNPKKFEDWQARYNYDYVTLRAPLSEDDRDACYERLFPLIGKEYDYKGLIIDQPEKIRSNFLKRIFNKGCYKPQKNPGKRLYCSEAVALVYNLKRSDLSPQELYNELLNINFTVIN